MQKGPPTPKGFRDILPHLAKKRREIINKIAAVLDEAGFVPIETPTIEFSKTLIGKYGDEEKLIYQFKDRGQRELALRYDLTVPLSRFIANNQDLLTPTFSRYQIGQVFRGENPQAGRYREFTQFDFDTLGSKDHKQDAKIIALALKAVRSLGLGNSIMNVNDRKNFENIPPEVIRAFDKLHKIEKSGVEKELKDEGYSESDISNYFNELLAAKPTSNLKAVFDELNSTYKLEEGQDFIFDATLARGLDYYTDAIFELKPNKDLKSLSIGAGGRYDNLIGVFAKKSIPAVGFSFGIDRLIEII